MHQGSSLSLLARTFERNGSRPLLFLPDGRTLTYGEFWSMAEGMARRLGNLGLKEGDRLLIQL